MASGPFGFGAPSLRRSVVDPVTGMPVITSAPTGQVVQRAGLLPLGRTDEGRLTLAAPQAALGALEALAYPGQVYRGERSVFDPQSGHVSEEAVGKGFDLAGTAMAGGLGGAAVKAGETALGAGPIRAYHGSPHSFDRFSMSKIDTGEGAQAFGRGLYFAENEAVAKGYRDSLGGEHFYSGDRKLGTLGELYNLPEANAAYYLEKAGNDRSAAYKLLQQSVDSGYVGSNSADRIREAMRGLDGQNIEIRPGGHMYEVAIDADPARMLDLSAPLRGQKAAIVQDLFPPAAERISPRGPLAEPFRRLEADPKWNGGWDEDRVWRHLREAYPNSDDARLTTLANRLQDRIVPPRSMQYRLSQDATGMQLLESMENVHGPAGAAERLREVGVPGASYFDSYSRGAGEGSRNYVTFSDDIVSILRKYGLAGAIGAGGAMAAGTPDQAAAAPRPFGFGPAY